MARGCDSLPGPVNGMLSLRPGEARDEGGDDAASSGLDQPGGYLVKKKILASVLATVFAWTLCGVGDAHAEEFLGDMPSTGEFVAVGVSVAVVITVIIVAAVNSGADENSEEGKEAERAEKQAPASGIEPVSEARFRIDPVLTLQKDALGRDWRSRSDPRTGNRRPQRPAGRWSSESQRLTRLHMWVAVTTGPTRR